MMNDEGIDVHSIEIEQQCANYTNSTPGTREPSLEPTQIPTTQPTVWSNWMEVTIDPETIDRIERKGVNVTVSVDVEGCNDDAGDWSVWHICASNDGKTEGGWYGIGIFVLKSNLDTIYFLSEIS